MGEPISQAAEGKSGRSESTTQKRRERESPVSEEGRDGKKKKGLVALKMEKGTTVISNHRGTWGGQSEGARIQPLKDSGGRDGQGDGEASSAGGGEDENREARRNGELNCGVGSNGTCVSSG